MRATEKNPNVLQRCTRKSKLGFMVLSESFSMAHEFFILSQLFSIIYMFCIKQNLNRYALLHFLLKIMYKDIMKKNFFCYFVPYKTFEFAKNDLILQIKKRYIET